MRGGGALDRIVQIRRGTVVSDGFGTRLAWNDANPAADNYGDPHPASKADISDGERWRAGEVQAHVTTRFVLRWSPWAAGISPKDRLVCEGRVYEIVGVKEAEGRRQWFELTCAARSDQ
jgi:head-tail adaptor